MIQPSSKSKAGIWGLVALLALSLVAAAPAAAHEHPNHGTIKVHDSEDVDPAMRNQPHVSCDFWIEGFMMSDDSGHLEFERIPPSANPPVEVMQADWTADDGSDEDGYHFNAGPFQLDPGHYKVYAFVDSGHPGSEDHFSKTKTFWVNPCPDGGEGTEPTVEVPCPPDVTIIAQGDGDIVLEWGAVVDADAYRVYRSVGDEDDFNSLMEVDADTLTFVDTDTEVGVTYSYYVTAVIDGVEVEECEVVEATAIPFFPGFVGAAAAGVLAIGAYVTFRRRN